MKRITVDEVRAKWPEYDIIQAFSFALGYNTAILKMETKKAKKKDNVDISHQTQINDSIELRLCELEKHCKELEERVNKLEETCMREGVLYKDSGICFGDRHSFTKPEKPQ